MASAFKIGPSVSDFRGDFINNAKLSDSVKEGSRFV